MSNPSRRLLLLFWVSACSSIVGVVSAGADDSSLVHSNIVESGPFAEELLLDAYNDGYAAYALLQLRTTYGGPAVRVRRDSDNAERDFGFTGNGSLVVSDLESWLGGANGYVVRWYSQVSGKPDLVQERRDRQPRIAASGKVVRDAGNHPSIQFEAERGTYLDPASSFPSAYSLDRMLVMMVAEVGSGSRQHIVEFQKEGEFAHNTLSVRVTEGALHVRGALIDGTHFGAFHRELSAWIINTDGSSLETFANNYPTGSKPIVQKNSQNTFRIGASSKNADDAFNGYVTAFLMYPGQTLADQVLDRYSLLNAAYHVGPDGFHRDALLPQEHQWQVDLYSWLKTISMDDVRLPSLEWKWDGQIDDIDTVADLWLQLEGASVSRVVRGEPEWYVLDAGNGKGIEATGEIRIWHEPENGKGNPPRSWSNEPAFLYQLDVPNGDGSQGNPYFHLRPLGLRALIVAAVDMMMYANDPNGYSHWTDMHGKALLGWAEAFAWTKAEIPEVVQQAFEDGFALFLDRIIKNGARGVNTNMDMFAVHAAAEIYMTTDDADLKAKALQAVRRIFFGFPDGELGVRHETWTSTGDDPRGVYSLAGYIMEGGQPDIFYQGESLYHLVGALAAITDRNTGKASREWEFLASVVKQMETWFMYQGFGDPGRTGQNGAQPSKYYHGGAGFAGRTGAPFPEGQASYIWRDLTAADFFDVSRPRLFRIAGGHISNPNSLLLPDRREMEQSIRSHLSTLTSDLSSPKTGTPGVWSGWSPWTKATPYLPPYGWYSRLEALINAEDPSIEIPSDRTGYYYSQAFGGPPIGPEYWAYKGTDGTRDFGWFVEAQPTQGPYGGWYGGKLETFWTSTTGVILLNRHGKGGCDDKWEDSVCWENIEYRAAHHVWGRNEEGKAFTPLHITDEDPHVRSTRFDLNASTPSVEVVNYFNAPGDENEGEQSGDVLQGDFQIRNRFEAVPTGVRVTHTVVSDQKDQLTELWASLPIFLRSHRPGDWGYQSKLDDTSIEYLDGELWVPLPEDDDNDGIPEIVRTRALRLGRDFKLGDGIQYAYVKFEEPQRIRLASRIYSDPYQTRSIVRTVHIDLHGQPGSVRNSPAEKAVQYTLQTVEPSSNEKVGTVRQDVQLKAGWNWVSRYVEPAGTSLRAILANAPSCLVAVKDGAGMPYVPEDDIDAIGEWRAGEGYQLLATESCTFSLVGEQVSSATVELKEGWNLVGFPFSESRPVEDVMTGIPGLLEVRDDGDKVYLPGSLNEIDEMRPGKAYMVKVDRDSVFEFPVPL